LPAQTSQSALPLGADLRGQIDDLPGVALNALAVEGRCGNAAGAVVGFAVGGDEAFAEQDFHALLGAVFPERGGFIDEDLANVGGLVEQNNVVKEDFVVGGAAVAAQVLKQQDGIARLEELVEEVEGQIEAQAGRVEVTAMADKGGHRLQITGYRFQVGSDGSDDLLVDFFDGVIAFDKDHAIRFAERDFPVFLPHACIEGILLRLEAIFILTGLGLGALVAAAGANERRLQAGQQEDSQVGVQVAADEPVKLDHGLGAKLPPSTLVGLGGVGKAVAEDDFPLLQRRLNHLGDGLGAVGEHQGHFRHGSEAGRAGVEDEGADAVAGYGASGLAQEDGIECPVVLLQPGGQTFDLGGFAGSVKTFEGDEETMRHGRSLSLGHRVGDEALTVVLQQDDFGT